MDPYKRNYKYTWTGKNVKRLTFTRNYDAPMYRRDMYFALDAEMVGVGPRGMESALARVALVNWENEIVFHCYVKPEEPVTDYRSHVSGIRPEHIYSQTAIPVVRVRKIISTLLKGKVLIGHGLENDLKTIGFEHPWCDIRDTATYEPLLCRQQISSEYHDEKEVLRPRKLKDLALEKLRREIQVMGKPHCPIEDAIASMDLYKMYRRDWETDIRNKFNSVQRPTTGSSYQSKPNYVGHDVNTNANSNMAFSLNRSPPNSSYLSVYASGLKQARNPQQSSYCDYALSRPLESVTPPVSPLQPISRFPQQYNINTPSSSNRRSLPQQTESYFSKPIKNYAQAMLHNQNYEQGMAISRSYSGSQCSQQGIMLSNSNSESYSPQRRCPDDTYQQDSPSFYFQRI